MIRSLCLVFLISIPLQAQQNWPIPHWKTVETEAAGLDGAKLSDLDRAINAGRYGDVHSVLIVRNGLLCWEKYYDSGHVDSVHTLQSVSKSFTSALLGMAIDRGQVKDVEQSVMGFFPEYPVPANLDARKESMRLKHLLTMRSGTDYHERGPGSPHYTLNDLDSGWDRFYLDRPMTSDPGSRFQYDSGGVILISAILKQCTGAHADVYADSTLFPALQISQCRWYKNSDGHPHTGGGLFLRSRDMARFGLLYLRKGQWNGRQVISEKWIEKSFAEHVDLRSSGSLHDIGYGYLWWILEPDPAGKNDEPVYAAKGFMGQFIFVIPEHDMVVVTTGGSQNYQMRAPIDFLYTDILPAVKHK